MVDTLTLKYPVTHGENLVNKEHVWMQESRYGKA